MQIQLWAQTEGQGRGGHVCLSRVVSCMSSVDVRFAWPPCED